MTSKTCLVKDCPGNTKIGSPGTYYFEVPFDPEARSKWLPNIKHRHLPGTVLKYSFVCQQHFSLRPFLPNKGGPHRLYTKALPTVNLKYKEEDGQAPFIEVELEDPDPFDPMEVEDTLMEKVLALEEHNYSSNILSIKLIC